MANFNDMVITESGKKIYAKALAGKKVEFVGGKVGNGRPSSGTNIEKMTGLVTTSPFAAALQIDANAQEGIAQVDCSISNKKFTNSLEITEIGLFCKDPDTGEVVMYSYCYAPTSSDVIPPVSTGEMTWKIQFLVYITNATGSNTSQGTQEFTPEVKAVATDASVTFLSNISATGKSATSGALTTVLYKVTGTLANMESAESKLSKITVSLPKTSLAECTVYARMTVDTADGSSVLVDCAGVIAKDGKTIDLDYFGSHNGTFTLLITAHYFT